GLIGQTALEKGPVRLAHRADRGELYRRALDERTGSHYYLVLIARHLPGLRRDVGIHRGTGLYAAADTAEVLRRFERHGLDDIVSRLKRAGLGVNAELLQHSRTVRRGLKRLGCRVRRQEKALEQLTVCAE